MHFLDTGCGVAASWLFVLSRLLLRFSLLSGTEVIDDVGDPKEESEVGVGGGGNAVEETAAGGGTSCSWENIAGL